MPAYEYDCLAGFLCPVPRSRPVVTNCIQCLFIGPGLLIIHPLFYGFTVADW